MRHSDKQTGSDPVLQHQSVLQYDVWVAAMQHADRGTYSNVPALLPALLCWPASSHV
jgi:hypothetical protein